MQRISIIGSGFSSISSACYLAKEGYQVSVYEKNEQLGGRARQLEIDGFRFDMGPSWYWMPDVFDQFFRDFNKERSDFYTIKRLDPSYRVYFKDHTFIDLPSDLNLLYDIFEKEEKGSSIALKAFIADAKYNYDIAINKIVHFPGKSPLELITYETVIKSSQFFKNISSVLAKKFKSEKLRQILEFPVLFLGAKPSKTPYFYCFMNYADLGLGTWYPEGGMNSIVRGMVDLAKEIGVSFYTNSKVEKINVEEGSVSSFIVNGKRVETDIIVSGGDYHHTEQLLPKSYRNYSEDYWDSRTFAPSALLFYVGFDKKIENVLHHTLFFDTDFNLHAEEIYDSKKWPESPLFYGNFTSITDKSDAPNNCESGFFLIPIAPGIKDDEYLRENYFKLIIERLEKITDQEIYKHVIFKKSYCIKDFINDYNSYKGNAYGLANTLKQTAFLKPKLRSKKLKNLFFTGQLTVPGPGVPPALISGKIVSKEIINEFKYLAV